MRLSTQGQTLDALCIRQHDAADQTKEFKRMGDVYSNAYVTIISTDLDKRMGNQGFLFRESSDCVVEVPCEIEHGRIKRRVFKDNMTAMLAVTPQSAARVNDTDWSKRGRTLQEDLTISKKTVFLIGHGLLRMSTEPRA